MTWKTWIALPVLLVVGFAAHAQSGPRLKCVVNHEGKTFPMYYFGGTNSHHISGSEYLSVIVKEKLTAGKLEIQIMEMAKDEVWDKLVELTDKNEMPAELRKGLRNLGRTRMTTVFAGLYAGVMHYAHKLGTDSNLYEISCQEMAQP
ncbi:MAG: hypothetical protein KF767_10390 [Bdellovibrionaceae bacterium]|nr:hypothetical protein [Pseudobdellovibrionaceae bacterium]